MAENVGLRCEFRSRRRGGTMQIDVYVSPVIGDVPDFAARHAGVLRLEEREYVAFRDAFAQGAELRGIRFSEEIDSHELAATKEY